MFVIFKSYPKFPYWGRRIHLSHCNEANAGKAFRKIIGGTRSKKRMYNAPLLPTPIAFSKGANEGKFSKNSRRSFVLNKLFMRHITDLMATGENSNEFLGHGIEINNVEITPDFKGVNVFWISKGSEKDDVIEKILQKNSGYLRHELSSLKVMGVVPKIQFVKDKRNGIIADIDKRLAMADYGDDHVPLDLGAKLKTKLELHTPLSPDIREKIENLDDSVVEEDEEPLPPMPQNVLGLNHAEILCRIKKAMKKSQGQIKVEDKPELSTEESAIEVEKAKQQRIAFKEFLNKRELIRTKARKELKNYTPDIEYMKEEMKERQLEHFKNLDIYDTYDDKDFIEEDDIVDNDNNKK